MVKFNILCSFTVSLAGKSAVRELTFLCCTFPPSWYKKMEIRIVFARGNTEAPYVEFTFPVAHVFKYFLYMYAGKNNTKTKNEEKGSMGTKGGKKQAVNWNDLEGQ